MLPIPDLLHLQPRAAFDPAALSEVLEMAFLGGDQSTSLEKALESGEISASGWRSEYFQRDLFLDALIKQCFVVGESPANVPLQALFFRRVLENPPIETETIAFRQRILVELEEDSEICAAVEGLYRRLSVLVSLFRATHTAARINFIALRLEILQQVKTIVDSMVEDFGSAASGLKRIHESGLEIQQSNEYQLLAQLLQFEGDFARLTLHIRLGADGRLRDLQIDRLKEIENNAFYRAPWQRWLDRLRIAWRRYDLDSTELVNRVVTHVYVEISPALHPLMQVLSHLQIYLATRSFARRARAEGLEVCLPEIAVGSPVKIEGLFNPLLFGLDRPPVPCNLAGRRSDEITMVTGPNSGGKTRLLQAIGIAQVLGQSGLYTSARRAALPLARGLFAFLTVPQEADQTEGRLGTELVRIRTLFQAAPRQSLILLDELCSGTNPSEAEEIVTMVLDLLQQLEPIAYFSSHFLDFGARLREQRPIENLAFLQVQLDDSQQSTYQFIEGVATTSLAATTAERLGVTFDQLEELIRKEEN